MRRLQQDQGGEGGHPAPGPIHVHLRGRLLESADLDPGVQDRPAMAGGPEGRRGREGRPCLPRPSEQSQGRGHHPSLSAFNSRQKGNEIGGPGPLEEPTCEHGRNGRHLALPSGLRIRLNAWGLKHLNSSVSDAFLPVQLSKGIGSGRSRGRLPRRDASFEDSSSPRKPGHDGPQLPRNRTVPLHPIRRGLASESLDPVLRDGQGPTHKRDEIQVDLGRAPEELVQVSCAYHRFCRSHRRSGVTPHRWGFRQPLNVLRLVPPDPADDTF